MLSHIDRFSLEQWLPLDAVLECFISGQDGWIDLSFV